MAKSSWVYFHGLPGAPDELHRMDFLPATASLLQPDRLFAPGQTYEDSVLNSFDALDIPGSTDIAGFSLGAMSALHVAARRPSKVRRLLLISPAAPLELGDFLLHMAGRPVFDAARGSSLPLWLLSTVQGLGFSVAPKRVLRAMFSGSCGAEQQLLRSGAFAGTVSGASRACLGVRRKAYHRELRAYVHPWANVLDHVQCPVTIFQGEKDNWAPPAMADALARRLGESATLTVLPELGHYSTLEATAHRLHSPS